jgi:hypothetical protein
MTRLRRLRTRRRGLLAALALVVVGGVVVAAVLITGSASPTNAAGKSPAPAGSAMVERRNLVQTDTEAGTLSYANPQTVYDRLSGTITWVPTVGHVIRAGGALFRVNGDPVILMDGSTPAYRTLSAAETDGADVLELNRNLVALGFNANGITVDDVWQPGTSLGVELLQESLGETATGSLSLGKVVFLPGPQLVSTVEGTVGDTANGGSSATPASVVSAPPVPEFVGLSTPADAPTTTTTTTTTSTTPTTTSGTTTGPPTTPPTHKRHRKPKKKAAQTPSLAALLALLKAESAQLKAEAEQLKAEQRQNSHGNSPSNSSNSNGGSGNSGSGNSGSGNSGSGNSGGGNSGGGNSGGNQSSGSTGEAMLGTTSTHLVVTVDLDASLQSEAKVGEHVLVQLPAGNTVHGKVTAVSSVAQSSNGSGDNSGNGGNGGGSGGGGGGSGGGGGGGGSGSASTIPVTITLLGRERGAGLDEAAVSVSFARQRANNVLSVPVTALIAVSGGNYAVQEAAAPHSLIPVNVGLFAAGYVQVSGQGIYPGLQVSDSQG